VERFTLHGLDPRAARKLNESPVRGLLPVDLPLILLDEWLLLEFTDRPFDPIEFDRLIAIARQAATQLPTIA
jgi:hypothetical protein